MKIKVRVHTNSSRERIEGLEKFKHPRAYPQEGRDPEESSSKILTEGKVWIKEKAVDNKANKYLEKFLKKYFGKEVVIKSGFTSRNKIIEILE
jgi:uncharacterized protein (TIGR00251 family)